MSLSDSARRYRSALRYSRETGSPAMGLMARTCSRISLRNSRDWVRWARSALMTGSSPPAGMVNSPLSMGYVGAKLKTVAPWPREVIWFSPHTGSMGELTVHTGTWMPEDRFASPWHYLPVEVAPGTAALRVELEYDRAGAVLDLGCVGPSGFRGWSGSARESFLIGAESATPGYLPGEVEAGLWQVMLGLHAVPPDGVRYRVTAEPSGAPWTGDGCHGPAASAPPVPASRPATRELPARPGFRWLAGDLHAHTLHSDGAMTVP